MLDNFLDQALRHPRSSLIVIFTVLVLIIGSLWWNLIWQSPQNVFKDMLSNNLSTLSVTKYARAGGKGQSIVQYVRLELGSLNASDWLVTATQDGSTVTTDSIGTDSSAYIRYTKISTGLKQTASSKANFASVLDVWGKADGKTDPSLSQLFSNSLLDISDAPLPPIGYFPSAIRQNLINYMFSQNIFTPDYQKVKSQIVNGRPVYTYQVAVKLGPYVRLMQSYALDLGITSLESVNPSQYSTAPPVKLIISVDRDSHQLVKVSYPASGFSQSYSNWGILTPISLPHKTISTTALQDRLQAIH